MCVKTLQGVRSFQVQKGLYLTLTEQQEEWQRIRAVGRGRDKIRQDFVGHIQGLGCKNSGDIPVFGFYFIFKIFF